jgi:site-specific recombinase XerD
MKQQSLPLYRLIDEADKQLEYLNYRPGTRKMYRSIWQALLRWSQEGGVHTISSHIANQFLESIGISPEKPPKALSSYQRNVRSLVYALKDFAIDGCLNRHHPTKTKPPFPPAFETTAKAFLKYRKIDCDLSPHTLYATKYYLLLFTSFLESRNIESCSDIQPENIREFFTSQIQIRPGGLASVASIIRVFLRYLWLQEILPSDFSLHLSQFRFQQHHPIPSVWRREDVEALLRAVDRESALGKRDYAILILVIRLGLRAGEIRSLKLEHIRWEKAQLQLFQPKTKNTVLLPLIEEVGQALIDYIRNGRPSVTCREVFVRHLAPLKPFSIHNKLRDIIIPYYRKARIPGDIPSCRGMHSLRYTLATRLLEQETPMETIAAILGHASVETTRIYTKVDLEALRSAALDPEELCHEVSPKIPPFLPSRVAWPLGLNGLFRRKEPWVLST